MDVGAESTVFLFSGNRRPKHFDNVVRAIMLQRGMLLHVRYRRGQLEPAILADIEGKRLANRPAVTCYLFSEPLQEVAPKDRTAYAIRQATIADAYVVGPSVHIYCVLAGYPRATEAGWLSGVAHAAHASGGSDGYFAVGSNLVRPTQFCEPTDDDTSFAAIVDRFDCRHLQRADNQNKVEFLDPLFLRVQGLYRGGELLQLTELGTTTRRGYILRSDAPLDLRVQFYQPEWSNIDKAGLSLTFETDKHFDNPKKDRFDIASAYDKTEFLLMPHRRDTKWLARATLGPATELTSMKAKDRCVLVVPFEMLLEATPVYPPWLNVLVTSSANSITILLALIATIVGLLSVNSQIPRAIVYSLAGLFFATLVIAIAGAFIKYRQR